jgi:hypothetical protein
MADDDVRWLERQRFEKLYREQFGRVAAYLAARADRDLAGEAISSTFEIAWRRIADVPQEPLPWLLGVARIVGTVLYVGESTTGSQIQPLQGGRCLTGGGGCPIGLKIPKDFSGSGAIALGRPAKPGEEYQSAASAFAPGEPLHCSGLLGAAAASAMPAVERDKFTTKWNELVSDRSDTSSTTRPLERPPTQGFIWGAELTTPGHLTLTTEPTPWPDTPGAGAQFNKGC